MKRPYQLHPTDLVRYLYAAYEGYSAESRNTLIAEVRKFLDEVNVPPAAGSSALGREPT